MNIHYNTIKTQLMNIKNSITVLDSELIEELVDVSTQLLDSLYDAMKEIELLKNDIKTLENKIYDISSE